MPAVPITIAISLGLTLTFVALFFRERARKNSGGPERDSLLPLAEETARIVPEHATKHSSHKPHP